MLGLKVKSLNSLDVPSELLVDVVMEKKLDELDEDNLLDISRDLVKFFLTPQSVTTLAGYIELWANIRPLKMELYADLAYQLLQLKIEPTFKKALLQKADCSFLRFCYLSHVFTIEDIKQRVAADPPQAFFFVPELGITKGALEFSDILKDDELLELLQKNDWEMFRDLIEYGYTANTLEYAIKFDDLKLMLKIWKGDEYYLNMKMDENKWEATEWKCYNPLSFAARYGAIDCFRYLLKRGAEPDENICENAVIGGNKEIIEAAASMEGDFLECLKPAAMYHRYDIFDWIIANYQTEKLQISTAVAYANWPAFLFCAANGADIRDTNFDYTSALHWAAYWGIPYVMEVCLSDSRAQIDYVDGYKMTPLIWAALEGNIDMIEMLLKKGAKLDACPTTTPLIEAVRNGHQEAAEYLLSQGDDIEMSDKYGFTVLHVVPFYGNVQFAQMLLDNGAILDAESDKKQTPLHIAAKHGSLQLCKLFLKKGAEIDAQDINEETPLFYAVRNNQPAIVKFLVNNGADITIKNSKKNQVIHIAAKVGNEETVIFLLTKGANPREVGYDNRQPIEYAANQNIQEILLDNGAIVVKRHLIEITKSMVFKTVLVCIIIIILVSLIQFI